MPQESTDVDRRRQPRVQLERAIRVRILRSGRPVEGYLYDLNHAGAFVATDLVLEKNSRVHLELEVPGLSEPQPVEAIVARCSREIQGRQKTIPAGLGLVFLTHTPEERELIQQVVTTTLALDMLSHKRREGSSDTDAPGRSPVR
ncbi:MAG: PilZ domain-containing protein [Acidobacteriota bacterium]